MNPKCPKCDQDVHDLETFELGAHSEIENARCMISGNRQYNRKR